MHLFGELHDNATALAVTEKKKKYTEQGVKTALAWRQREGHGQVVCCITKSNVACAHNEWLDCKDFARFALLACVLPLPVLADG